MKRKSISLGGMAAIALLAATSAEAGGLERGGYNIDLLFDPSDYVFESAVAFVNPQRDMNNVRDNIPLDGDLNGRAAGQGVAQRVFQHTANLGVGFQVVTENLLHRLDNVLVAPVGGSDPGSLAAGVGQPRLDSDRCGELHAREEKREHNGHHEEQFRAQN